LNLLASGDTAVVTGGAGFIGSHLVDALIRRGLRVRVLDDFSTGKQENLQQAVETKHLSIVVGHVTDPRCVRRITRGADVIFHLAAKVDVQESMRDPIKVNHVNVAGTVTVLEACRKADVNKFVFASSSAVYLDIGSTPIDETAPLGPISPYGTSKLAGEAYVNQSHRTYGMDTTCLRFFNVYGPRQAMNAYSGVITIFVNRLLRGKAPLIYGNGKQTRDFVHVSDIARASLLVAQEKCSGGVFNVGTGKPTSIAELAILLRQAIGQNKPPLFSKAREGDILHNLANIQRIQESVGFKPAITLADGLRDLVRRYQS
jgi:UDP-glucose 4-epimerase